MDLVEQLAQDHFLPEEEYLTLLQTEDAALRTKLFRLAQQVALDNFSNKVYIRGLIEFTSYCKRDCLYCGLRCSNKYASRYRLSKEQILACCRKGHSLGFRTFVLQGGEDGRFSDPVMCDIVYSIKSTYPDCAITLSLGERSHQSYQNLYDAGADRYLLRFETADSLHYSRLHPSSHSLEVRKECLFDLKEIGYQVGSGFLVGAPYEVPEYYADHFHFLRQLDPAMIGIGPFIPHQDTPFRHQPPGDLETTLRCVAILRLMFPRANIPATTALASLHPEGRLHALLAGANVLMPNLTPPEQRAQYKLYDKKTDVSGQTSGDMQQLYSQLRTINRELTVDRGDYISAAELAETL